MPSRTAILTICSNNYLPQAEVFFASARAFHPDADLVLGLADAKHPDEHYPEGVEVLTADSLGIPDFPSFAFAYDVMEFNTAIKPFLMLRLLERGYRNVVYFDPDIELYRRLDELLALLDGGASFVLTPHFSDPPGPGAPRTEHDIMQTGVYNLGFLAASQSLETEPILRWWARHLRYDCVNAQHEGLFVDQKYMDLLPGLAAQAHVLRHTGYNVAYWNLPRRVLSATPDGIWQVDGRPLCFFHFSGFAPGRPHELSKYTPEPRATGALAALLHAYALRRLAARAGTTARTYAYGRFRSGVPVPDMVRRMFRKKHLTWSGDPFAHYDRYCRLPHPAACTGDTGEIVTNLMQHHHAAEPALHLAYHLDKPVHVSAYTRRFAEAAAAAGVEDSLWRAKP